MGCERVLLIVALAGSKRIETTSVLCVRRLSSSLHPVGKMQRYSRRTKRDGGADKENGVQAMPIGDPSQRRASKGHRDIEEDRVDAHCQAAIFG